ncbi:hypothetical protein DZD52_05555 [Xanthomonas nasturtii]|uniref:Uncharacterized protein n=1 Tax=Xanthomonas nasturtii TaxID=1843581 RepID=A0A3E1KPC5_9XANT|nr:hypothetical protein DZD52_05555 [Xanthomonas nasturtii]
MDGGGVCAPAAVQTSNSPQQHNACARPDSETRDQAACENRDMRAPEAEEAAIVIRARRARQARTQSPAV